MRDFWWLAVAWVGGVLLCGIALLVVGRCIDDAEMLAAGLICIAIAAAAQVGCFMSSGYCQGFFGAGNDDWWKTL